MEEVQKHKMVCAFFLFVFYARSLGESPVAAPLTHNMVSVNGLNMHVVEQGQGPLVLFLHGFPHIWYAWRHQIPFMAARGYRAVAPDLRGYGDTTGANNSDPSKSSFVHIVGDMVRLLDIIAPGEKVFVVGHDFGAYTAWYFALFRPDRIKAMINLSVQFIPWDPSGSYLDFVRRTFGQDYYMIRFQKPGDVEAEFATLGTRSTLARILSYHSPDPIYLPQGGGGLGPINATIVLPPWITEEDLDYYTLKFNKSGFTGGINYYRSLDLFWELTKAWSGAKVVVPTIYAAGELDLQYNVPGVKEYVQNGGMKKDVPLLKKVFILKGAAHFIMEERPDEVNDIIHDFFNRF